MKVHQAYNEWASTYDIDRNLTRDLDARVIRKTLSKVRPSSVLELGCGTGKNSVFLARISKKLHALDFSEGMIAQAKVKVRGAHVSFSLADLSRRWPSREGSRDLVVCNLVLEHIKGVRHIFTEAHRVLRSGGIFFVSELHPFRQYQGKQANFRGRQGAVRVPAYVHNISEFLNVAEEVGFTLVKLDEWWHKEDVGKHPRLLSILFRKTIRHHKALQPTRANARRAR